MILGVMGMAALFTLQYTILLSALFPFNDRWTMNSHSICTNNVNIFYFFPENLTSSKITFSRKNNLKMVNYQKVC